MNKFNGTIDDLKSLVSNVGVNGEWNEIENGHQFRAQNDAVLCWYSTTGTLMFQGPKGPREELQRLLETKQPSFVERKPLGAAVPSGREFLSCTDMTMLVVNNWNWCCTSLVLSHSSSQTVGAAG